MFIVDNFVWIVRQKSVWQKSIEKTDSSAIHIARQAIGESFDVLGWNRFRKLHRIRQRMASGVVRHPCVVNQTARKHHHLAWRQFKVKEWMVADNEIVQRLFVRCRIENVVVLTSQHLKVGQNGEPPTLAAFHLSRCNMVANLISVGFEKHHIRRIHKRNSTQGSTQDVQVSIRKATPQKRKGRRKTFR